MQKQSIKAVGFPGRPCVNAQYDLVIKFSSVMCLLSVVMDALQQEHLAWTFVTIVVKSITVVLCVMLAGLTPLDGAAMIEAFPGPSRTLSGRSRISAPCGSTEWRAPGAPRLPVHVQLGAPECGR
jgi:hypothetical protein